MTTEALAQITLVATLIALSNFVGAWAERRRWTQRGDQGYPRMHAGGKLYWCSRDDKPCFRCEPDKAVNPR